MRCLVCGGDASVFRDLLSRKEYGTSGMCQDCQDDVFAGAKPEDSIVDRLYRYYTQLYSRYDEQFQRFIYPLSVCNHREVEAIWALAQRGSDSPMDVAVAMMRDRVGQPSPRPMTPNPLPMN